MSRKILPGSYYLEVIDNEVPDDLQTKVYNFLLDREYCVNFYDQQHSNYYFRTNTLVTPRDKPAGIRCPLAWDEESLKHRANTVYHLWKHINGLLDNKFTIEGVPESMNYITGISPLQGITKSNGDPGAPNSGWRVYGDGLDKEYLARTKCVHRDNPFMDDDSAYSAVYFANSEWHPQLYGETLFHSDDAYSGDFTGKFEQDQPRNFPIGDVENVVVPRPGRIMIWESRYLHQIKPVACYAKEPHMVISFRLKKI